MLNVSTYLLVGPMRPAQEFRPTHWAFLSEAPQPAWHIAPVGISPEKASRTRRWLTTDGFVVHDAMAMVAAVVEQLPATERQVTAVTHPEDGSCVDLTRLSASARQKLLLSTQQAEHKVHIVLTVLYGSMLYAEMHNFARYSVSVEICTAHYSQDGSLAKFKWPKRDKRPKPTDSCELN